MQLPIQIDRACRTPLQMQLASQLRDLILGGRIKCGAALPGSREMAQNLKLSRNTVLLSYDQLIVEGFLEPRAAKGTFVSKRIQERMLSSLAASGKESEDQKPNQRHLAIAARDVSVAAMPARPSIDFAFEMQGVDSFPNQAWRRLILQKLARAGSSAMNCSDPSGLAELRQAIANHLGPARGLAVHRDQVIIVNGVREALNVICRSLPIAGMPVVVENPTARVSCQVFESYGARTVPVPTDQDGLKTDSLPDQSGGFIYLTPSHQFPTGGTLPVARRSQLLQWAEFNGSIVIEDDQGSDFCYENPPLTSLAGMTRADNVIHIGDFSNSIGGVRIGYMIVPPRTIASAIAAKAILSNGHSWLDQAVLADFIESGAYAKHLRRIQRIYKSRRDILIEALDRHFRPIKILGQQSGIHIVWQLPTGWPAAREIEVLARSRGVGVYSLHKEFADNDDAASPRRDASLIMGYASLSETLIKRGVQRLSDGIADMAISRSSTQ